MEEYAAVLKLLYYMAHSYRDKRTRNEDLVRKFLNGINNEDLKCKIKFHKDPKNIDEAVYYAVYYVQIRSSGRGDGNGKHTARRVTSDASKNLDFRTNQRTRDSWPMYRNRYETVDLKAKLISNQLKVDLKLRSHVTIK
ncbi:hypothetical protein DPMN_031904 [Dreissena polymorpha]|uniref:Uncharacterized protein n=1 Tax=Dreissena polymorpha TaxID=45954 RepID=A0A9D4M3Z9_DREPO|nr:hypothetical protein DPMN_031904 [Dreissena polymorpha]